MVRVTVLIISSKTAVEAATSLMLEIKFWPEMKSRDNNSKSNEKQKQTSQKNSIIYDNIKMVQIL